MVSILDLDLTTKLGEPLIEVRGFNIKDNGTERIIKGPRKNYYIGPTCESYLMIRSIGAQEALVIRKTVRGRPGA
jgi:hypothetical protein